ncbi:hypothetical protein ACIGCH_04840 [Pseudomonas helleri]|uniref:Uncharacterized protein n=1 Tax=Pseudomonas helleri TaxID=1608996 RepID=A0A6A7YRX8_9PSED|nr:hypothetical protein [Pseudomonas helleri]MQT26253.1 hypothetical protein [Pseudomonas helleri]MQT79568.1 hypothetical protein [Pseudomonas helleri]MQU16052.1 hypothetical protein [Pseudomonas helleri]MQU26091.1 hypothetical protein [Pseudomonas helleri]
MSDVDVHGTGLSVIALCGSTCVAFRHSQGLIPVSHQKTEYRKRYKNNQKHMSLFNFALHAISFKFRALFYA